MLGFFFLSSQKKIYFMQRGIITLSLTSSQKQWRPKDSVLGKKTKLINFELYPVKISLKIEGKQHFTLTRMAMIRKTDKNKC